VSTFNASYEGIGELLKSPMIEAEMRARAEQVAALAEASAPVDPTSGHPGRYKGAFSVSSGVKPDRAYGRVENTAPEAIEVEYGRGEYTTTRTTADGKTYTVTIGAMDGHRTLGKALFNAAGD
jgi:hypothetical protein